MTTRNLYAKKFKHVVTIRTDKRLRMINKEGLPFRMKVPENYHIKKQAERDSKTFYGKGVGEGLTHEVYEIAMDNETNGQSPFWIGWKMYWAGYARGIRTQRKNNRNNQNSVSRYTFKDLRELHNLTIDDLSDKTNISPKVLKMIEYDSSHADLSDLKVLSNIYNISLNYIYNGKN